MFENLYTQVKQQQQQQVPTGHSAITRKGYSPDPSHKPYNQDAMVVERDDVSGAFLFCVFDGHGEFGHRVSKYFESRIAQEIFAHPDFPVRGYLASLSRISYTDQINSHSKHSEHRYVLMLPCVSLCFVWSVSCFVLVVLIVR